MLSSISNSVGGLETGLKTDFSKLTYVAYIMKTKYFCEFCNLVTFRKENCDQKNPIRGLDSDLDAEDLDSDSDAEDLVLVLNSVAEDLVSVLDSGGVDSTTTLISNLVTS